MYVCMYVRTYVCVCMYVCMYVYTHAPVSRYSVLYAFQKNNGCDVISKKSLYITFYSLFSIFMFVIPLC
jgi:hypothetical protein